MHKGI